MIHIENIVNNLERSKDPKMAPVNKTESDRLLAKLSTVSGDSFGKHITRLRDRCLVFPIGSIPGGHSYTYFHKPNDNTFLSYFKNAFIIFDSKFCALKGDKITLMDNRYDDYFKLKLSKEADPTHLYRGCRGEEMQDVIKNGYIQSTKDMNGSFQMDITCFTPFPWLAFGYAYSPVSIKRDNPTFNYPSFVLKVKTKGLKYTLTEGCEAWVKDPVSIDSIAEVWEIRLGLADHGRFDLIEYDEGIKLSRHKYITTMTGLRKIYSAELKNIRL